MIKIPLLLADPSPNLRRLVLTDLLNRPREDPEVQELSLLQEEDPVVSDLLVLQADDGSWSEKDLMGTAPGGRLQTTSQVLMRLGYLGFNHTHKAIKKAVQFLFSKQRRDGSWQLPRNPDDESSADRGYTMMPLQTSIPLMGIAASGHATDLRAEKAYEWLLDQRLEDGAWPTGMAGEVRGYVAGYRRLPHSRWGCRTNTTAALLCLAMHPKRRNGDSAKVALEHLLARETKERRNIGYHVARIVGFEKQSGWTTYFARSDPALILDLCSRVGGNLSDARITDLVEFVKSSQGSLGIWECSSAPSASRWITFDLLRALSNVDRSTNWFSIEPRTPFKAYLGKPRRH
ncbi:MAG: hypothetical protein EAX95_14635 [Candidatus Thorarchaeota archaeon]|nr:hypothetical protein [Candidatus Thorarchaeota archaeon]